MRANFSPARKVRSTTAPDSSAFSFVRTNAPPFPGFTCWNSTIRHTKPSSSMCIPFLNWFVEMVSATAADVRSSAARGDGRGLTRPRRAEPDLVRRDHLTTGIEPDDLVRPCAGVERLGSLDVGVDAAVVDRQIPDGAVREDELDVRDRLLGEAPDPRVVPLVDVVSGLMRAEEGQERRLSEQRSRRETRGALTPARHDFGGAHLARAVLVGLERPSAGGRVGRGWNRISAFGAGRMSGGGPSAGGGRSLVLPRFARINPVVTPTATSKATPSARRRPRVSCTIPVPIPTSPHWPRSTLPAARPSAAEHPQRSCRSTTDPPPDGRRAEPRPN